jgi:hypothetical protein
MIDANNYKAIANFVSDAQNEGSPMYERIGNVLTSLINNQIRSTEEPKLVLQSAIESTYEFIFLNHDLPNQDIMNMTTALQNHVTCHATSVNNYLEKENIKVPETFAELSALVGYPINDAHIEG